MKSDEALLEHLWKGVLQVYEASGEEGYVGEECE